MSHRQKSHNKRFTSTDISLLDQNNLNNLMAITLQDYALSKETNTDCLT